MHIQSTSTTKKEKERQALREAGIDPESLLKGRMSDDDSVIDQTNVHDIARSRQTGTSSAEPPLDERGILVTEHGKSRYLDTSIWTSLKSELGDLKEILDETSDEDSSDYNGASAPELFSSDGSRLLFGSPKAATGLRHLHPQPTEAFKLWQVYLDNINPLVKLFHAPTVQQTIAEANGNLDGIP
ncbi:sequence-specific DNA binding RNA polymerase II transcription factor [Ascochyta rabiei]|uniref:Sequence-specific DNA binding RNA polymerase II transcription factor n=1 Tax=Didymella rabiei TaxID=5454 RepID=A0A163D1C7_DIDRA|nr:sequence-specific DNA binding RNA polymerase II transcription factor [Ascochyta rabiei]